MRKMLLAVIGAGSAAVLLTILGIHGTLQWMESVSQAGVCVRTGFPMAVAGTDLIVRGLSSYQGPFWEDTSDEEVGNVAALLIENTGGYVAEGAVVLEWGEDRMVFELYDVPPESQVLVLEKDKQAFRTGIPTECYGWEMEMYPEMRGYVAVEPLGERSILVNNCTDQVIPVVWICYRSYDPQSGVLIGGISYGIEVRNLQPEECRVVTPGHYIRDSSLILYVTTWVE